MEVKGEDEEKIELEQAWRIQLANSFEEVCFTDSISFLENWGWITMVHI